MNKQRKVVITTTYNEMGVIIDTKAEEVAQQNLQPTCNQLATDTISRQAAIDALEKWLHGLFGITEADGTATIFKTIRQLPPIQPKRGRWHYSDGKLARIGLSFGVICDQCGTESEYCTNFCGECGADMRGEQDG